MLLRLCFMVQVFYLKKKFFTFQCTDDSHPDKAGLKQAIGIMSDVATAINEFKRQKDLGKFKFLY